MLVLSGCAVPPGAAAAVLAPIESGPQSAASTPAHAVVANAQDFARLYGRIHAGRLPPRVPPKIDFKRAIVVAVFLGARSTAGYRIVLRGPVTVANGVATVSVVERRPAPDSFQATVMTSPYAIASLQRGDYDAVRFVSPDGEELVRLPDERPR